MCRAPSVLSANRSMWYFFFVVNVDRQCNALFLLDNVDWGLLNFMQDWFPLEAKEKLLSNEQEALAEELEEMGVDPNGSCLLM